MGYLFGCLGDKCPQDVVFEEMVDEMGYVYPRYG
jgi:hypothetical protein